MREAAARYPDSVNVAAAALAGPRMDMARITISHPGAVLQHRLSLAATSRMARLTALCLRAWSRVSIRSLHA